MKKCRVLKVILGLLVCVLLCTGSPVFGADKLNINNATVEQLTALPGIGPSLAGKIVEYRTGHAFASVEQIKDVKGIGPAKFEAIKDLIMVEAVPAPEGDAKAEPATKKK